MVLEQVKELKAAIAAGKLPEKDLKFANSLIENSQYRPLSIEQARWLGILVDRTRPPPPEKVIGDFSGVYALFERAAKHLKHPKIRLLLGDAPVTLYVAGERSRMPGVVNVVKTPPDAVDYGSQVWLGRVAKDGKWAPARNLSKEDEKETTKLLKELAKNPEVVAANYGRLTGRCCFCYKSLADERSTQVGYGPVCASRYGLKWGTK